MARVTAEGLRGMVGPVIFYTVRGNTYARSKGKVKRKRNKEMNPLNSIFGTVSKHGSAMIKIMSNSFLFPFNRDTYNKLRGWMRNQYAAHKDDTNWELSVRNSGMCQINPETDIRDFYKNDITVTDSGNNLITVSLPEINPKRDFKTPPRTMKVNLKLIVLTSSFKEGNGPCKLYTQQLSFFFNNEPVPATMMEIQTDAGAGDIALVNLAVEYEITDSGNGIYNKEIKWLPAATIAMGRLR